MKVEECDDTDSNKTEVEEIEMVDMEGRAEVNFQNRKEIIVFRNPHVMTMMSCQNPLT